MEIKCNTKLRFGIRENEDDEQMPHEILERETHIHNNTD